jgi:PilZ domain
VKVMIEETKKMPAQAVRYHPEPMTWPWRREKVDGTAKKTAEGNIERRMAPRVPVSVAVRFSASGNYEFTGTSKDMSTSGIFLYAESEIEEGEQVEVMLSLPSKNSPPISVQVKGKVVRVEKSFPVGLAIAFRRLIIAPEAMSPRLRS